MKLSDFNTAKQVNAQRALRENYGYDFNFEKLSPHKTSVMLKKVRAMMQETKQSSEYRSQLNKQSYMKLVFMEQALSGHMEYLRSLRANIVTENKEVDRSTSLVAAQEMIDSIQKMVVDVSDMLVKELPALASSIESDVDVNKGKQFQQSVTETLKTLQQSLEQGRDGLTNALNAVTGDEQVADFTGAEGGEEMAPDMGEMPPEDEEGLPDIEDEEPLEEPEEPQPAVGRQKR